MEPKQSGVVGGRSESYDPSQLKLEELEGLHFTSDGYVKCKTPVGHPRGKKWIYFHCLVMEKSLGRVLEPWEVVHHKDHVKSNNWIGNLELFEDSGLHLKFAHRGKTPQRYPNLTDEEWLREKYLVKGWTTTQIAQEVGSHQGSVHCALRRFKIEKRRYTMTERALAGRKLGALAKKPRIHPEELYKECDPNWIKEEYLTKQRSLREIGEELKWHKNKVKRYLQFLGLEARSHKEQATLALQRINSNKKQGV